MSLHKPSAEHVKHPGMLFDLRWRFEYTDGTAPSIGIWNRPAGNKEDLDMYACFQKNRNIRVAMIEGRDVLSREYKVLFEVAGQDFCLFKWVAMASAPALFKGVARPRHMLCGLQMVSRYEAWTIFPDGQVWRKMRSADDLKINYAAYGQ